MQIDQYLRRLTWRTRRRLGRSAADNEPLVAVETPTAPPAGRPRKPPNWLSVALATAGFVLIACAALMAR